jgi:hypothetical protein
LRRASYRPPTETIQTDPPQLDSSDIPIWVNLECFWPSDTLIVDEEDFLECEAEVWLSMAEIRKHFGLAEKKGQDDEWLACGRIPLVRVKQIVPYNKAGLFEEPQHNVRSGKYVFNFQHQMWLPLDFGLYDKAAFERHDKGIEGDLSTPMASDVDDAEEASSVEDLEVGMGALHMEG